MNSYPHSLNYKHVFVTLFLSGLLMSCFRKTEGKVIATEAQLGEALFFDPALSRDSSISCAGCHKPEFAFADNAAFSKGIDGNFTTRNTPSAMNQSDHNFYFWDGRSESLEHQALGPVKTALKWIFRQRY